MGDFGRWLIKETMFPEDGVKLYSSLMDVQKAREKKYPG